MGRSFLQSREITIIDMLGLHLEGVCTLRNKQHFFDIQITKVDPAHIPEWLKSWILPLSFSILPFISLSVKAYISSLMAENQSL